MENCLVTKLKGIVNNDSLDYLGCLIIKVTTSGSYNENVCRIALRNSEDCVVSIVGSGYFALSYADLSDPSKRLTTYTIPANTDRALFFSNGDYKFKINKKYTLATCSIGDYYSIFTIETPQCAFCEGMSYFRPYDRLVGDISYLKDMSALTFFSARISTGLTGDLSSISSLDELETLNLYGCPNVVGDANIFTDSSKFVSLQSLDLTGCLKIANRTAEVKAAIEAAHSGISVVW